MDNEYISEEEFEESQASFMEWWEDHIPKNFITMLNAVEYAKVTQAIKSILRVVYKCLSEDDEEPQFDVHFDKLFGTHLALDIIIPSTGISANGEQIAEIVKALELPERYRICILPKTNATTLLQFTFYNVKEMIAHEEKKDLDEW